MKNISLLKIQKETNKRIKRATDSLLNDDKTAAKDDLEWIELATKLNDKLENKPTNKRLALIIGLSSVLLISLGLTLKIPKTNISVDLIAKSVVFNLEKEWDINSRFSSPEVVITNLKEVHSIGANIDVINDDPFSINLKGKNIVIDKFILSPDSEFAIQLQNNTQIFSIKNDSLVADIEVADAYININNGQVDTSLNSIIPQIIEVRSFKSVAIPITVLISDTAGWSFRDVSFSDIKFWDESPPGSGKFLSSIISGTVKVLEIDKETKLEEKDWLLLENLANRRTQITKSNSVLKIHIEGEVSKVSAGSALFERNLKPTIIEYLYYAKSFAFFWSCIVFIWSLLWSFKNTLLSK